MHQIRIDCHPRSCLHGQHKSGLSTTPDARRRSAHLYRTAVFLRCGFAQMQRVDERSPVARKMESCRIDTQPRSRRLRDFRTGTKTLTQHRERVSNTGPSPIEAATQRLRITSEHDTLRLNARVPRVGGNWRVCAIARVRTTATNGAAHQRSLIGFEQKLGEGWSTEARFSRGWRHALASAGRSRSPRLAPPFHS